MLTEQEFSKPGIGALRVVGDVPAGQEFTVNDVAFAEFETEDGTIYGPLNRMQAVLILAHPAIAVEVCEMNDEALEAYSRELGF